MSFFKTLFNGSIHNSPSDFYTFAVQCKRCGEVIEGRINLNNDLSVEYEGNNAVYFGRKVLMSSGGQCFQQIEVELKFNIDRKLLEKHSVGGQFVEGD
ncbi:MAG: hypothetical protein WBW94_07555 [Anaerolineales bacterium]